MPVTPEEDVWIKDVEIINFQSLRNVHVKFINGTNALIGVTNSGKTAIIRAIIWCLINRPHGDHFITVDEKEAMYESPYQMVRRLKEGKAPARILIDCLMVASW